jgi:YVTN family beta-propeller protein
MRSVILSLVVVIAVGGRAVAAADAAPSLKVLKTLPLGGEGRWDYLCADAQGARLYVPRSTHVQVVDLESGKLVGDIPNTNGVHGVALAPEQNLGFSSNGRDNSVSVFDLKTLKEIKRIKAGKNPDAILFDPASKHIFAFNHSGGDVTVIDPASLETAPITIPVGGALEYGAADGAGHVFVNVEDKGEIVEIDSKENKVLAHWPLENGATPTGLAIDLDHHRLFAGCGNQKMYVVDFETGKVLSSVGVGNGVDGAAFDASLGVAMSSNGRDGTISVVKETAPGKFEVVQTPKTFTGAKTITMDSKLHHALLPCNVPDGKGGQTFGIVIVGIDDAGK